MNSTANSKWFVIVNPNAGSRKGEKDWKHISELLDKEGFEYEHFFTERKFQAIEVCKKKIEEGYKNIIAVGGDGTLNEAANGIFLQNKYNSTEITLGMITVGTGNDWGRMYNIPTKYKEAVKTIKRGRTFVQDAGFVNYQVDGKKEKRYFVNMAGMGYDALVAQKTNAMKERGKGGALAYLYNIFTGLFQYKTTFLEIDIDNERIFEGDVFSLSLGICKFNGGGMMQLPNAIPDDGIFDVTVIRKTTKSRIIRNVKNLYDGTFLKLPEVETFRGRSIAVVSRPKNSIYLETDGESLGHSPLEFMIIPRSIKVIVENIEY